MFSKLIKQMEKDGKIEGRFLEMINIYQVKDFECSKIPWLLQPPDKPDESHRPPSFDFVKTLFFNAVCASVPKYLAKKYYTMEVPELITNCGEKWNYATLSCMYMMGCEVFGLSLMKTINSELQLSENFRKKEKNKKKRIEFDSQRVMVLVLTLQTTYGGVGVMPILSTDYCATAKEFLLQPCVLIQVPWKPVVLQQWLIGGLVEVLMFEKTTLELRHWPLPAELQDCASKLLALVRDLKSRMVLGFAIIGRMVHTYPDGDPKIPHYILEDVVLPSVPILNFLISGKAHETIKNIKNLAWTNSPQVTTKTYVHESSYTMNEHLEHFNVTNFYCFFTWSQSPMTKIFPNPEFDVHKMGNTITNPSAPPKKVKFIIKPLSIEEKNLLDILEKNQTKEISRLSRQDKVQCTFQFIADNIIVNNQLPGLTAPMVMNKLLIPQNNKLTDEIYDVSKTNPITLAIRQVLLSKIALHNQLGIQSFDVNAVTSIMSLQLKCLEREQRVRLAFTCSEIFKLNLQLKDFDTDKILSCEEIMHEIVDTRNKICSISRSSLFSMFPREWRRVVSNEDTVARYRVSTTKSHSNVELIVGNLQERIGRLVTNIAVHNFFTVHSHCKQYPHFSVVHYVLPLFLAAVAEHESRFGTVLGTKSRIYHDLFGTQLCKPIVSHLNVINLSHELIKHYETLFIKWCDSNYNLPSHDPTMELNEKLKDPSYYKAYSVVLLKYREMLRHLLLVHTGERLSTFTSMLMCYDQILNYIFNWTAMMAHIILDSKIDTIIPSMSVIDSWLCVVSNFVMDLFQICQNVFDQPVAGKVFPKHLELGELYFANVVLNELEVVFEIAVVDRDIRDMTTVTRVEDMLSVANMDQHLKIYKAVVDIQYKECSTAKIENVITEGKESMLKLYNCLKDFRRKSGCILKSSLYKMLPNASNPIVTKAVQYYINGNLDALDAMLTVFKIPFVMKCRQCGTTDGELRACKDCLAQNFPDVNYFCSKACGEARWNEEHMEEHLEFELGLAERPVPDGELGPVERPEPEGELGLAEHPKQQGTADDTPSTSQAGTTERMKRMQI